MFAPPLDNYQKEQAAIQDAIKAAAKKSDNKTLKSIAKSQDGETRKRCQIAEMVFHESLESFSEGRMTFPEMIEDLTKALKAVS